MSIEIAPNCDFDAFEIVDGEKFYFFLKSKKKDSLWCDHTEGEQDRY